MNEKDLEERLKYSCAVPGQGREILGGYTSDLLSDVMGNAPSESVLITIQAHKNTVAVAELAGIHAIVLCNKRIPDEGMLKSAEETGIGIYCSEESQFVVSNAIGKLLGL